MSKTTYTLASIAPKAGLTAKGARAKFRRMKKERPFDHKKVTSLSQAQVKAAIAFLKKDFRAQA